MRARALALLVLAAFGFARLRFEEQLARDQRVAWFHGGRVLNLEMRQRLGQMGFVAALSGFRALVADLLWLDAHAAWERTEWGRMKFRFDTVTALQPRALLFWDMAGWHMAWNASFAALDDRRQPREALRIKAQREYFRIGEDFLLRGIQNNPDKPLLYDRLGLLYREKFRDSCKAAAAYEQGAKLPGAAAYLKRFAAYELARCAGREREAYERLRALYLQGPEEQTPTMLRLLPELEEKLNVPPGQRIYIPPPSP